MKRTAIRALGAFLALALAGPASAFGAPALTLTPDPIPATVPAGTFAQYTVGVSNSGTTETSGVITVNFSITGEAQIVKATDEAAKLFEEFGLPPAWSCSIAGGGQSASCTGPEFFGSPLGIGPTQEACRDSLGIRCRPQFMVRADSGATSGTVHATITACGGGATICPAVAASVPDDPFEIVPFDFHVSYFDGKVLREDGEPATQAASHPYSAFNGFSASSFVGANAEEHATETIKDAAVELPPGFVGNPQAVPTCEAEQLLLNSCPADSQVGIVRITYDGRYMKTPGQFDGQPTPVYNMEVPHGLPALFAFNESSALIQVYIQLRTGTDYGVDATTKNIPETLPLIGTRFEVWGVPADPSHDAERVCPGTFGETGCASTAPLKPLLSLPTSCTGPMETTIDLSSWLGTSSPAAFLSHDNTLPTPNPIGNDGCNAVDFSPSLEARPTTNVADSASGLDVDVHVPQHETCDPGPPVSCEAAEANLRDTTVTLPQGLAINPASANGLDSCSEAQFGYTETDSEETIHTTPDPASCPDASKLGTVEVDTPLLEKPLDGAVYLAAPHANPFGSLLALYIAVDDPKTGIVVKLAGEVQADPQTGQLTTSFKHSPQLTFEDFKLHFFGGAGGPLRTPATCGTYSTTSVLTPWTAPEGLPNSPSDSWQITQAPGGGTCPTAPEQQPNSPSLDAGSITPIAGASTPTVVNLRREDGSQEFSTVSLTLPPGLTGKLAGISYCPEAALTAAAEKSGREEEASPSCPAASRIGRVDVAAGAGPAPYYAHGTAYLTGPYKGAPLGMAIVTPAVAGPYDLGTVVVRVALRLDRATGQITSTADPLPRILQGIPLDIRSARVLLDRPDFTRNGTSCDPSSFTGQLTSTLGNTASLSNRFQLGECTGLSFKPKLSIRLIGGTKRGAHPALTGFAQFPEGGANVAKASVALPRSEFLDQGHIGTVCTRVQFATDQCPADSVYGSAKATSPLVDYTLEGPVYLRSSEHELPDLVAALKGPASQPIEVDAAARIDSIKGGIRSTFEGVPDLPVSTFTLEMQGGRKGLLQNSTNICKGVHKATALFDGQNGKAADLFPALKDSKCPKARKGAKRHRRHKRAR